MSLPMEGPRPVPAPKPEPGIYWLRITEIVFSRWVDADGNTIAKETPLAGKYGGIWAWGQEGGWELAEWTGEDLMFIGGEEGDAWEGDQRMVTTVGPKVEPPT